MMRAISLHQPWASAIALGLKKIETRGWSTAYRGDIAIHAAKTFRPQQREFARIERALGRMPARLPLGCIVCVVRLVEIQTTDLLIATGAVGPIEKLYGDYRPGRFGWLLENVRVLSEPVACTGRQRFFNIPDDLLA